MKNAEVDRAFVEPAMYWTGEGLDQPKRHMWPVLGKRLDESDSSQSAIE